MAVRDASIDAVIANPSHSGRCVVYIGDSAGAVTALGTVGGVVDLYDPLEGAEVTFSIDAHGTCTLRVKRQLGKWSFSPLSVGGGNPLQPTEARFAYGRRVQVFAYVTPPDAGMNTPATTRWVFDGVIDSIAWPNETMEIVCSDRTGTLRDTFIERERMYGFCTGATRGAEVWRYDIGALGLNTVVVPSKLRQTGHWYFVSVAGTPAVTEPAWPTGAGATVVSGTCTFTEGGVTSLVGQSAETIMGQLLTDNPSTGSVPHPALYTPVASGWVIKPFIQSRMSLLKALEVFPEQIGWRLHMWWDQANAVGGGAIWYLRFIVPDRARAVVDKTIPLDHETDCSDLSTNGWMVRNVIHVVFPDTTSRDPGGQPWRVTRIASDAPSIAANGRRFMEIREDDTSQIQTAAQADTLAAAVLADLKDAPIGLSVQIPSDPWCDVGDMVKVLADGFRYSTDQTLAAQQVKHAWGDQSARTELTLLGKPAARREGWLVKDTRLRGNDPHATVLFDSESITESVIPVIGGARIGHSGNGSKQGLEPHYEIHISETAAFTVSAATLKAVAAGDSESRELAGLIPGKTYYRQTVPFSYNAMKKVRGSPSAETSFVAGRAHAGHLEVGVDWGRKPLNSRFATWSDTATECPDHWEMGSGNFSDSWSKRTGTDGLGYGAQCVAVLPKAGVLDALRTKGYLLALASTSYVTDWRVRVETAGTGVASIDFRVRWYDRSQAFISETTLDTITSASLAAGTWYSRSQKVTSPGTARFAKLAIVPTAGGANDSVFNFAEVFIEQARLLAPEIVGDTSIAGMLGIGPTAFAPVVNDHIFDNNNNPAGGSKTMRRVEWASDWKLDLDQQHVAGSHIQWNLRAQRPGPTYDELLAFKLGNVGVGTTSPAQKLDVNGQIVALHSHVRAKTATAGSYASGATITWYTEEWDTLNEFVPGTGIFTATIAGKYHISAFIFIGNLAYNAGNSVQLTLVQKNSGGTNLNFAYGYRWFAPSAANWYATTGVVTTFNLAAGDTVRAYVSHDRGGGNLSLFTDASGNYISIDRFI